MSLELFRQPTEIHMNFHQELCVGCGACVTACIDEHDLDLDSHQPWRRLYRKENVRKERVTIKYFAVGCLHCQKPDCQNACPKDCFSIDKDTGVVQLDAAQCIGCRRCAKECHYKAVIFDSQGKATKCDGCISRLKEGLIPACVQSCPRQAITIDERWPLVNEMKAGLAKELASGRLR